MTNKWHLGVECSGCLWPWATCAKTVHHLIAFCHNDACRRLGNSFLPLLLDTFLNATNRRNIQL
jgi:hypothetical protein